MGDPRAVFAILVALAVLGAAAPGRAQEADDDGGEESADTGDSGSLRRSNRMEFDERLVKGQAASSGAVYLFKRVPRQLPGLVPLRVSYRSAIVEPVLGERELEPPRYSDRVDGGEQRLDAEEATGKGGSEPERGGGGGEPEEQR